MAALWPAAAALLLLQIAAGGTSDPNPDKFLIVSAPRDGKVAYARVTKGGKISSLDAKIGGKMQPLISSGLIHPQGLAVEQRKRLLLVADPDVKKIYAYTLFSHEASLSVGERKVIADGVEARWVAVDGVGHIYFSDEPKNQILKISTTEALRGNAEPQVIYNGSSLSEVSSPGGLAVDSFRTFWVNKQAGKQVGSVVSAMDGMSLAQVTPLAKNSDKSYGICLAYNNVFYTQPEATVYAVKKSGSPAVAVTSRLTNPRGCAWDGDGTVYVADRGANAVFSFAANMQQLGSAEVVKAVDFEDAFGLAVFSGARRFTGRPATLLLLTSALALLITCVSGT